MHALFNVPGQDRATAFALALLLGAVALVVLSITPPKYGWLAAFILITFTAVLARRNAAARGVERGFGSVIGLIVGFFTWLFFITGIGYMIGGVKGATFAFYAFVIIVIILLAVRAFSY